MLRRAAARVLAPAFAQVLALASLAASDARAGGARCWLDHGAVVVSARFGDIAGDFLLDTSSPTSALEADVAMLHGVEGDSARAVLRIGPFRRTVTFAVKPLDARTWGFPTTLNGLIGADALAPYVVDLRLAPCRIEVQRRRGRRLRVLARLPLRLVDGIPTVRASVGDGERRVTGLFAIDTGTAAVRLAPDLARLSREPPPGVDPASRLAPPARLAALTLGRRVFHRLPAAIEGHPQAGLAGAVGTAVWARYRVRLDFRRRRLILAPP
jgi:hypothetical protein